MSKASSSYSAAHTFRPAAQTDSRSPCPALNALANHGYLPRDGRNIGLLQLIHALREVYNLSFPLAAFLSLVGVLLCGHAFHLNLHELAAHNKIEHDGSLVHADAGRGSIWAPIRVDPVLLLAFLERADNERGMSLEDLAKCRIDRTTSLKKPLDSVHAKIGTGEAGLSWLLLKEDNERIPFPSLLQWFGQDKLPDGWKRPAHEIGMFEARGKADEVSRIMQEILYFC